MSELAPLSGKQATTTSNIQSGEHDNSELALKTGKNSQNISPG